MKAYDKFNDLNAKLTKLLTGNLLAHKFYNDRYPLVLIVRPEQDIGAQMTLLAADDGASSPDASLEFRVAADGMRMKINGRLLIEEALMNKIKNLVKNLVNAYLFGQFAERFTKNGDDITYSGTPDDEDEPTPAEGEESDDEDDTEGTPDEESDDKMMPGDNIPDDAAEPDPFAEFFGDNTPADASTDEDAE